MRCVVASSLGPFLLLADQVHACDASLPGFSCLPSQTAGALVSSPEEFRQSWHRWLGPSACTSIQVIRIVQRSDSRSKPPRQSCRLDSINRGLAVFATFRKLTARSHRRAAAVAAAIFRCTPPSSALDQGHPLAAPPPPCQWLVISRLPSP